MIDSARPRSFRHLTARANLPIASRSDVPKQMAPAILEEWTQTVLEFAAPGIPQLSRFATRKRCTIRLWPVSIAGRGKGTAQIAPSSAGFSEKLLRAVATIRCKARRRRGSGLFRLIFEQASIAGPFSLQAWLGSRRGYQAAKGRRSRPCAIASAIRETFRRWTQIIPRLLHASAGSRSACLLWVLVKAGLLAISRSATEKPSRISSCLELVRRGLPRKTSNLGRRLWPSWAPRHGSEGV